MKAFKIKKQVSRNKLTEELEDKVEKISQKV